MAGGTWRTQNKVRPGVYIRFDTKETAGLIVGERGTVAICEPMSWGAVAQITEITADMNLIPITGYDITAPQNRFLREIFKGTNRTSAPQRVLLYRPATSGAAVATATIPAASGTDEFVAAAAHAGVVGNNIAVIIVENDSDTPSVIVRTLYNGAIVAEQTITAWRELEDNDFARFHTAQSVDEDLLPAVSNFALTGGADGTVESAAYASFLVAIEPQQFDVIIYDGADAVVQAAMTSFVNRLANENGQYVQLVGANMTNPDTRFVTNVASGVVLDDGAELSPSQVTWWVGGALAGASYNQSLTYATYPGAVSVTNPMTNSEIIAAINEGKFVLFAENGVVKIEYDINSLVTYTPEIGRVYRKNRVIRLCNTIANDIYAQFSQNYIGVVNNNDAGRSQFRAAIVGYLLEIQAAQGIQNFDAEDVEVLAGNEPDAIIVNIAIQAVDAVEKIYMTIEVS